RWHRRREGIRALSMQSPTTTGELERVGGLRTAASAIVLLLLATAVGGASASVSAPEREREVLRDVVDQPFDPREFPSPLSGFRRYHQPALADSAMFTVAGLPEGARIRLATLDTYDGAVFSVGRELATSDSGSVTRLPTSLERDPRDADALDLEVEIAGYEGIWMPVVGLLSSVDFEGPDALDLGDTFFFNDVGHAGVVLDGFASGDGYRLQSVLPAGSGLDDVSNLNPGG